MFSTLLHILYSLIIYAIYGTAYYTAFTITLYMLSFIHPIFGFVARILASYAALILAATYGIFASLFLRLLGPEYAQLAQWTVARFFKYVMILFVGVHFEVDDPEEWLKNTRPCVMIGNHQTELDVLMIGSVFPKYTSVTAKKSLKRVPILGWFMSLSGTVFIDRANRDSAISAMAGAADVIRKTRQSVFMFPEGTRSYYREPGLLPFKKGAFHLAIQAGVPIIPVVVENYSHILYVQGKKFNSGTIKVKILEPIQTTNLTAENVDDLTRDTREKMLKELHIMAAQRREQPPSKVPIQGQKGDGVVKASGSDSI